MRRTLLIILSSLFGSIGLLWAYLAIDIDPDDQSPKVQAFSYWLVFKEAATREARRDYDALDPRDKQRVLTRLAASKGEPIAREVAFSEMARSLPPDQILAVVRKELPTLTDDQFESAIGTIAGLGTPKSKAFLDDLWKNLDAAPIAHTPLGDYRPSTLIATRVGEGIEVAFKEQSRIGVDYKTSEVSEIALFLPTTPDWVIGIPNVDDVIDHFNQSRFVQSLDGSPVPGDIWSLPLLRTLASLRTRLDETMGMLAPYFSPERFFKDQLVMAKYEENYLVACYKDKNLTVANGLLQSFGKLGRDFGVSTWQSEGETIHTIRNRRSGRSLSYAVVGPYFVTSTDTALIRRSVRTYVSDRRSSFAINPTFARTYSGLDQSGQTHVLYFWGSPSKFFDVIGSQDPSARRRHVLARALKKDLVDPDMATRAGLDQTRLRGSLITGTVSGLDPLPFWRYVVDVRSIGKNHLDSLARLSGMNLSRDVVPYFGSSMAFGYTGIEHLTQPYGFSNTSYRAVVVIPLARTTPPTFDETLRKFLSRMTSLDYRKEVVEGIRGPVWIAYDTTVTDTVMLERKLRPSFAILDGGTLVMGTTPDALRNGARQIQQGNNDQPGRISLGSLWVDVRGLSENTLNYVTSYLLRTDRFMPEEIKTRFGPLGKGLGTLESLSWTLRMEDGLRVGEGMLRTRQ